MTSCAVPVALDGSGVVWHYESNSFASSEASERLHVRCISDNTALIKVDRYRLREARKRCS
jgi:RNase P/RNase MRP subunit p30